MTTPGTCIDISLPLSPALVVWPGDDPVDLTTGVDHDGVQVSRLAMTVHAGTHVDAPAHFLPGAATTDALRIEAMIGPALVVDVGPVGAISAQVLDGCGIPPGTERLLLKTTNSQAWARGRRDFLADYVAVDRSGARWLVERGVRLVGIDYLSIAPFTDGVAVHRIILGAGIIPLEGLALAEVRPGPYRLVCLPLRVAGADSAPARAVLLPVDHPPTP